MKVKAIKDYNDTQFERLVKTDEELDVTKERAEVLVNAKVAVVLEVADQEIGKEETAEKPKRRKKAEA